MQKRIKNILNKIIYDPVGARVLFDFGIALITLAFTYGVYFVFGHITTPLSFFLAFPSMFVLVNFFIGVYGKHKLSSLWIKSSLLCSSLLFSSIILYFVTHVSAPALILSTGFLFFATTMPRIFLNFNREHTKLGNVVSHNAPVLVVGGAGYIGTYVVEKLLEQNYKVRVFDKFLFGKDVFKDMKNIKNLELVEGDISDVYSLTIAVKDTQAVIHLAGIVGDPASVVDEDLTRHVNVVATRMLKETVKAFRIPRFIFASTCSVYGQATGIVSETSAVHPLSLYAQTKVDSEKELLQDTFDDFHPTILRFTTVFGHSRRPRFDLVANLFVAQAYKNGEITVFGGDQLRPFIHVEDVANAILLALKAPLEKVNRQIFNVGDDTLHYKVKDIAQIVKNVVTDKKVKVTIKPVFSDKRTYHVSFEKIHKKLGYSATITLEEGLKEIYENFKKRIYKKQLNSPIYSNVEMAKVLKEKNALHKEKRVTRTTAKHRTPLILN